MHGDLSPNNVVIDLDAPRDDPALYLIDFDAFFAAAAGTNRAVTVGEGGTYGTDGYCPPDLAAAASAGDASAAPYSDRYGRDMLLLEFLLMGRGLPTDDPPGHWNREQLQRQFAAWRARSDSNCVRALGHLDPAAVFELNGAIGRPPWRLPTAWACRSRSAACCGGSRSFLGLYPRSSATVRPSRRRAASPEDRCLRPRVPVGSRHRQAAQFSRSSPGRINFDQSGRSNSLTWGHSSQSS